MSLLSDLLQSIIDMPGEFAEVATQGSIPDTLVFVAGSLGGKQHIRYLAKRGAKSGTRKQSSGSCASTGRSTGLT